MDRRTFYALIVAMFTMALGVGLIVPFLPVYADELGASGIWIGLIFGINPLVSAVFTLFLGSMSDRMDKRRLMLTGLFGYFLVSFAFMFSRVPIHLFMARVMQGMFGAMVMPIARAYAGELVPRGQEGSSMGLYNLAFVSGFSLGPIVGGALWDVAGRSAPFLGMAGLTALAWVLTRLYVPSRKPAAAKYRRGGVDLRPLRDPHVTGNVILRTALSIGHGVFLVLLPLIGESSYGLTAAQIGVLVALRGGVESLMQPLMGRIADRVDRRLQVAFTAGLLPLALLIMPFIKTYAGLIAVTVLFGFGTGACVPASTAISVDKGRKWGMGSIMGLEQVAQSGGTAIGSSLSGTIMELFSFGAAFRTAGVLALLGVGAFVRLTKGYRKGEVDVEVLVVSSPPATGK
jgi:MFS family permease